LTLILFRGILEKDSKGIAHGVDDLLTTKQLQELLQVDRITIYRMLNDGRLQGFKVGGQWRFSHREIEVWLQEQQSKLDGASMPPPPNGMLAPSPQALPISCIRTIQDVCAEALEIGAVTIDPDGSLLTEVSNSCDFCDLILSSDRGLRRCRAAWTQVGHSSGRALPCHAGLQCISTPIYVNDQHVAITAGCQFVTETVDGPQDEWQRTLPQLAEELALDEKELRAAADSVRVIPGEGLLRIARLLGRVADTFSEIGQERLNLLSRLQQISEMSKV
jgi:excisionase family DNA binding protein